MMPTHLPELPTGLALVSTSAVAVAWVVTSALRKRSAAFRHFLWLLALAAPLVALPLMGMHAQIAIPILSPSRATETPVILAELHSPLFSLEKAPRSDLRAKPSIQPAPGLLEVPIELLNPWILGWFLGAGIMTGRILLSYLRVRRLLGEGCAVGPEGLLRRLSEAKIFFKFDRSIRLMTSALTEVPFCCGFFRATMIFPENWHEWEEQQIEASLTHELAHLVRRDLQTMTLAHMACILCWFNPLVWFAAARLRDEAENSADDLVLAGNIRPETYAAHLVALTERYRASIFPSAIALSMARPNRLKTRVEAILDSTLLRKAPSLRLIIGTGLLALAALLLSVSVRLTAAPVPANATNSSIGDNRSKVLSSTDLAEDSAVLDKPTAKEIYNAMCQRYAKCSTFSCTGSYEEKTTGKILGNLGRTDQRTFSIRYARPSKIRIEWTRSRSGFFGPVSVTNTIYTEGDKIYSKLDFLPAIEADKSIDDAISGAAGVSGTITYLLPPILMGKSGYLAHWKMERKPDEVVASEDCYAIELETKGFGYYTFDVRKSDSAILRAINVFDAEVADAQRTRAHQENPAMFNDPGGPMKTIVSHTATTEFKDIVFNQPLKEEEFRLTP